MKTAEHLAIRALTPEDAAALSDADLIAEQTAYAAARRAIEANTAVLAAEIGKRSHPDLGYSGLAQSLGARKPEILIQQLTGLSAPDARKLVRVGEMVTEPTPWMAPVSAAVTAGDLSVAAADAIRQGLGEPGRVPADDLLAAATQLVNEAPKLTLEEIAVGARNARAHLDIEGVPAREEELRARRWVAFTPLPNGNYRIAGELDTESKAIIVGALDAIVAPRRGGPRFVDPANAPESIPNDDRTVPQMMVDGLVDLVNLARKADSGKLLGARGAAVRVHVSERDYSNGAGIAHIEGESTAVSVATARRYGCESGVMGIVFDSDGQVMNAGREQRLHTPRMRTGAAARDGGCPIPGCDRPPSMCEMHHIEEWSRDLGKTNVEDGILLCRFHHMLVHNNGWRIVRDGATYWLIGPTGEMWQLRPKNPILTRLNPPELESAPPVQSMLALDAGPAPAPPVQPVLALAVEPAPPSPH